MPSHILLGLGLFLLLLLTDLHILNEILAEVCPDLLACCGISLPHFYGLCVEAAKLQEFNNHIADDIDIV